MDVQPFEFPESPNQIKTMMDAVHTEIKEIVARRNHIHKFDGINQLLDILHEACDIENVKVRFTWVKGEWFLAHAESPEDVLNLPKVLKRFGLIYRFHAMEYSHDDKQDLKMLNRGI